MFGPLDDAESVGRKELARNWRGDSILDVRRLTAGSHMGNIGYNLSRLTGKPGLLEEAKTLAPEEVDRQLNHSKDRPMLAAFTIEERHRAMFGAAWRRPVASVGSVWGLRDNDLRPHSSLGYKTPSEFAKTWRDENGSEDFARAASQLRPTASANLQRQTERAEILSL